MIYAKIKEKRVTSAIYYFGTDTKSMTGEVEIYAKVCNPRVIKYPEKQTGTDYLLKKLVVKYRIAFSNGEFPDLLSYEC